MSDIVVSDLLSDTEAKALKRHEDAGKPAISPATSMRFYAAFLNGASCEEIARLNPGFELGAIVHARLRDRWDEKRSTHMAELMENVRQRVMQTQMEAIAFVADQLAAAHKRDGEKIKKYLMSGDERDLDGADYIKGQKTYKDMVAVLLALTGQDKAKERNPIAAVQVNVSDKEGGGKSVEALFMEKPPNEDQAAALLRYLEEHDS